MLSLCTSKPHSDFRDSAHSFVSADFQPHSFPWPLTKESDITVTLPISGTPVAVKFDPAQNRQRYADERTKRLESDNLGQFQGLSDVLELDGGDPYIASVVREAIIEEIEVAVLGGGFGGPLLQRVG